MLKKVSLVIKAIFVIGLLFFIASFLGKYFWFFDLISHFRIQALVMFALCLSYFIIIRENVFIVFNVSVVLFILYSIFPYYFPQPKYRADTTYTLLYANVLTSNEQNSLLVSMINNTNPDIIALVEVNEEWMYQLNCIAKEYQYKIVLPHDDNFGVCLLSKIDISESEVINFCTLDLPSVFAKLKTKDDSFSILITHPIPPVGHFDFIQRNLHLSRLHAFAANNHVNMVVGDLNCSSFSPNFNILLNDNMLRDSRSGFGLQPTWPTWCPLFYTTLDHILVDEHLLVCDRKVLQNIGSDHLPLVIKFGLKH